MEDGYRDQLLPFTGVQDITGVSVDGYPEEGRCAMYSKRDDKCPGGTDAVSEESNLSDGLDAISNKSGTGEVSVSARYPERTSSTRYFTA